MQRELFRPFLDPPVRQEHLLRFQGPPVQQGLFRPFLGPPVQQERPLRFQEPPVRRELFLQFQDPPASEETQERQEILVSHIQAQQELEDPRDLRKMV